MVFNKIANELSRQGMECMLEEPMSGHTSFKIGGPAALMVLPKSAEELQQAVLVIRSAGEKPLVMGNGTNLLVTDGKLHRAVVKTYNGLSAIIPTDERCLRVGAGALLSKTAGVARGLGLTGLEFAHGIPGTLGGAVVMNAGAYGGEMSQVLRDVTVLDQAGGIQTLPVADLDLGYRHSRFENGDEIILEATIALTTGDPGKIQAQMSALAAKRRESQPLNMPSAGSTFKRPKTGYAAALIQEAGLKGCRIGGAQVSEKHAGFVVNRGGATFADVRALMNHVQKKVFRQSGVQLELEVRVIEEQE